MGRNRQDINVFSSYSVPSHYYMPTQYLIIQTNLGLTLSAALEKSSGIPLDKVVLLTGFYLMRNTLTYVIRNKYADYVARNNLKPLKII